MSKSKECEFHFFCGEDGINCHFVRLIEDQANHGSRKGGPKWKRKSFDDFTDRVLDAVNETNCPNETELKNFISAVVARKIENGEFIDPSTNELLE